MNFVLIAAALTLAVILYTLFVRSQDLPEPRPPIQCSIWKAAKLRFTKICAICSSSIELASCPTRIISGRRKDMQAELAAVAWPRSMRAAAKNAPAPLTGSKAKAETAKVCPHCGAKFEKALKFCGECGKAMAQTA